MIKVSREIPISEITLRKYERPYNLDKRSLVKKICLSIGILQPGDSRDVIVDVLQTFLEAKNEICSDEVNERVIANRKRHELELIGIAPSNIRRQIKRLRDIFLIEKIGNNYRVAENAELHELFEEKIENFLLRSIVERVKEYLVYLKKQGGR